MDQQAMLEKEANRILMGKLESQPIYMRVYILSKGEVFSDMVVEYTQLWCACVQEAAFNLGYD